MGLRSMPYEPESTVILTKALYAGLVAQYTALISASAN